MSPVYIPQDLFQSGGTVDIDVTDGIYRIECALTLDGDEEYTYSYTGEIIFHNRSQEGMYSTLNEDVAISGLSQGLSLIHI